MFRTSIIQAHSTATKTINTNKHAPLYNSTHYRLLAIFYLMRPIQRLKIHVVTNSTINAKLILQIHFTDISVADSTLPKNFMGDFSFSALMLCLKISNNKQFGMQLSAQNF